MKNDRPIESYHVTGFIHCDCCDRRLDRSTCGQVKQLIHLANQQGWIVTHDGDILCPKCREERDYE